VKSKQTKAKQNKKQSSLVFSSHLAVSLELVAKPFKVAVAPAHAGLLDPENGQVRLEEEKGNQEQAGGEGGPRQEAAQFCLGRGRKKLRWAFSAINTPYERMHNLQKQLKKKLE
jgi:hypothetical protein